MKPRTFDSAAKRNKARGNGVNCKNERYKFLKYAMFCAGDTDQFYSRIGAPVPPNPRQPQRGRSKWKGEIAEIYKAKSRDVDPIYETFDHIFHNFKKGIYVKIVSNELACFLPFTNVNYKNDILNDRQAIQCKRLAEKASKLDNRRFNPRKINGFHQRWYFNDGLIRCEYPPVENDTNIAVIWDMLLQLCSARKLPNVDFFINKRDFPILSKCGQMEPYFHLHGTRNKKLARPPGGVTPIFSQSRTDHHGDILFPTVDDWIRVRSRENCFFERAANDYSPQKKVMWKNKKNIGFWRGSSTGLGSSETNNQRIRLHELAKKFPRHLDAGITKWNRRIRKHRDSQFDFPRGVETVSPIPWEDQTKWKYLIHVEGHSSAYRLGAELGSGSLIFIVDSEWKSFISPHIKAGKHFISVRSDMSDLVAKIEWARSHDAECKKIVTAARRFYTQRLSKKGIFDYMKNTLDRVALVRGPIPAKLLHRDDVFKHETSQWMTRKDNEGNEGKEGNEEKSVFLKNSRVILKLDAGAPANGKVLFKSSKNKDELRNEYRIGMTINKCAEGFVKTRGFRDGELIKDFVQGETLLDYLYDRTFRMSFFRSVVLQIIEIIQRAQSLVGLIHNDLVPGNIILDRHRKPIIVDYGKSSANNETNTARIALNHECSIFNPIHDLGHFLVSTLYHTSRSKWVKNCDVLAIGKWVSYLFGLRRPFRSRGHAKYFSDMEAKFSAVMARKRDGWSSDVSLVELKTLVNGHCSIDI